MNREIKFRAWDKEINQYRSPGTIQISSDGKPFVLSPLDNGSGFLFERLKNIIIEQFTGLTDKNGVTYCQDDIVLYNGKKYRLIKGNYKFELLGFYSSSQDVPSDFFSEGEYMVAEIIGNIHENPELLKP